MSSARFQRATHFCFLPRFKFLKVCILFLLSVHRKSSIEKRATEVNAWAWVGEGWLGPMNPGALSGGDAGRLWRTRAREGGGRREEGRRRRSLSTAGRTEAPSPRPPRKRRREMPTSGKPAAECGGSDTEWKAKWRRRRRPSAKGRGRSPRPSRRAALARGSPPASLPALTHRGYLGPLRGTPAASALVPQPVAAVQEPRTPLQVGPGLA